MMACRLSIGITTRNRPASLNACLTSFGAIAHLGPEVLVFDDGSTPPVEHQLTDEARRVGPRVVRDQSIRGPIAGRNRLVRQASGTYVLILDDDTRLISADAVERAIRVLDSDPSAAVIAFAQAEPDGRPWPPGMQPSPATEPVVVPSFIGFAHLIRRQTFLDLGGYREDFEIFGEEKDYGLRLLDAGFAVVYLPAALIVHAADPASRDARIYLRRVARNDCLMSLYNDPLPRVLWMTPARYGLYFRMRRGWRVRDPWGGVWLAADLLRRLPSVLLRRRPVKRQTLARWAALKRGETAYSEPTAGARSGRS